MNDDLEVPLMLVGDPAYPLLPWLLKPYVGPLSKEEESFNCYLSSARMVVENAFGRLKGRWRCILKRIDVNPAFVPEVVLACTILHNFVERNREPYLSNWMTYVESENEYPQPPDRVSVQTISDDNVDPKIIRDNIKNFLFKHYPIRKSSF